METTCGKPDKQEIILLTEDNYTKICFHQAPVIITNPETAELVHKIMSCGDKE